MSCADSFVGIGMGAIQAGLFLPRAQEAGLPRTILVRRPAQAAAIARAGAIALNVATQGGLTVRHVHDVKAATLDAPEALPALIAATEIAVAVSSVADYAGLAPLLAAATRAKAGGQGPPALIYASENHLEAARLLQDAIVAEGGDPSLFQPVDTVIGKMSRTLRDPSEIARLGLACGTPALPEAWLIEAFDDIHISRVDPGRTSGRRLGGLTEHADLLPFERAKLNGHNAAHAAFAYAGLLTGRATIAEVMDDPDILTLFRAAFVEETGAALIDLHGGTAPLFSPAGWAAHADGLFARMANPWLADDCARVGRDPARKLGWDDRLVGTIRLVEGTGRPAPRWRIALQMAMAAGHLDAPALTDAWADHAGSDIAHAFAATLPPDRAAAAARFPTLLPA
ncbi:MAG: hypothetical protein ACU0CO_17635 [Shimia sp.]